MQLPYSTLSEAYSLVLYRYSPATALSFLDQLTQNTICVLPFHEDYNKAFEVLAAFSDQRFSLFDALLYALSERLQCQLWTYDHHFEIMKARVWRSA